MVRESLKNEYSSGAAKKLSRQENRSVRQHPAEVTSKLLFYFTLFCYIINFIRKFVKITFKYFLFTTNIFINVEIGFLAISRSRSNYLFHLISPNLIPKFYIKDLIR